VLGKVKVGGFRGASTGSVAESFGERNSELERLLKASNEMLAEETWRKAHRPKAVQEAARIRMH
jgi:hypothetical protein